MAQPTNATDRYDLATNGEGVLDNLLETISNISPTETPFQSNIGRETSSSDLKEWFKDSLATAVNNNAHLDGDDFSADANSEPARLGNYHQIGRKDIVVTRRADKVRKAGRNSELAYQLMKRGKELKRDVEMSLTANNAAVVGNATTAPETAGLGAWLTTNTSRGSLGADGALSSTTYGYPDTAATDGTDRALSEATFLGIIEDIFTAGGNPNMVMVSPTVKQRFSTYMFGSSARIATQYQDHGKSPGGGLTGRTCTDFRSFRTVSSAMTTCSFWTPNIGRFRISIATRSRRSPNPVTRRSA